MKHQIELDLFEQWLPIEGYENLYQVSNYGRVKSLNYKRTNQEKILKQTTTKYGYQQVRLFKDGKQKWLLVHRLVASAFIDNPTNLPQVNHIDECKTNNHVSNLEWCTAKYNINYGNRNERHSKAMIGKYSGANNPMYGKLGKYSPNSKQIVQLTLNNKVVKIWGSVIDVQRELGYDNSSISKCCKNKRKSAHNYKWKYVNTNNF